MQEYWYNYIMQYENTHLDNITGLFSYETLMTKLDEHINKSLIERQKTFTAFMLVDIYKFTYINNIYGHKTGDDLLKFVGRTIKNMLKATDVIGRVNTDVFGIILTNLYEKEDIIEFIDKLKTVFKQPFNINGSAISISMQIGIALIPDHGINAEEVYTSADIALSEAKKGTEWNYVFFSDELKVKTMRFLHYKALLEKAFNEEEFVLYYQPYFYTDNLCIAGFEALTRWNSQRHGVMPPIQFIPILEETGLILKLETLIIDQVCRDLKRINNVKCTSDKMVSTSINISPTSFKNEDVFKKITKIVSWYGKNGKSINNGLSKQINIEITESSFSDDPNKMISTLEQLRSSGFKISLDDFGTGYSSFSYLKDLPIDYLKIDISFVRQLLTNDKLKSITKSIIELAHELGIKTIAEGVETKEQFELLKSFGCDIIQGFWLAKPMPIDELIEFMEKWEEKRLEYLQ
jgi:diguanylate cyclase (GGDEF)-like protein